MPAKGRSSTAGAPKAASNTIFSAPCAFFFNDAATTEIYTVSATLSLHDALPISVVEVSGQRLTVPQEALEVRDKRPDRSEEHTSELQSPDTISYAVFCLKKK